MKKEELVEKLELQLATVASERRAAKADPSLLAARTALKRYQSGRLAMTHADLLAAPNTHDAAVFFLDELYGAHDLSQRDMDLGRIIPTLQKMLSAEALHAITEAIVLDALSEKLDTAMARALGAEFSEAQYIAAYRTVTARADRARQLDLVCELGESLCKLVRIPLLSMTLGIMRGPARLAGLGKLHDFLESGFGTFKKMRKPALFVDTIVERERKALANVYAERAQPFDV